jgi:hypothetical protein
MITPRLVALAAALTASIATTSLASAQTRVETAPATTRVDSVTYTGPDRGLLRTGVWTLGLGYVPALVVAIESPLPADRYLFVPVAGPWLDMARRECKGCKSEGLNQFLLAADGVVQGVGALEILGSFLFLERTIETRPARKSGSKTALNLRFKPSRNAGGYGLTAIGNF